jgi:hypothetical protein
MLGADARSTLSDRVRRRRMSAWGQQRICRPRNPTSVLPPRPDIADQAGHVGLVPIPGIGALLNHLVGKGEEVVRDFQAEGFGGFQINYQLEFGWLQDGQLRRVRAV